MKTRTLTACLTTLAAGCILLAAPLAAAPAPRSTPAPIAIESIGGTTLSITPQIAYERAVLRIVGPGDYALVKRFPAGTPITADLLAEAEPPLESRAQSANANAALSNPTSLPDGRYHYEVVFLSSSGERRMQMGLLYAKAGSLVSRETLRAKLDSTRSELVAVEATAKAGLVAAGQGGPEALAPGVFDEEVLINDTNQNEFTRLRLDNNGTVPDNTFFDVSNRLDKFQVRSVENGVGGARFTVLHGGNIGIGTTAPQNDLEIVEGLPAILLSNFENTATIFLSNGYTFDTLRLDSPGAIFLDTPADRGVGIGSPFSQAPLHVTRPSSSDTGIATIIEDGTLQVVRGDGITPNIRFLTTSSTVQSWLFQNNANSGVFAIRDETGGNSVLRLRPGAPENGLTINPSGSFTTSTGATLTAGGVWQNASSRVLKQEIADLPLEAALSALADLRAVTFAYKKTPREPHVGFIAEEVPDLVATASRKTLSAMEIVGVLTRVMQEQQRVVQEQQKVIAAMKQADAQQAKRLAALEAQSGH